MAEKMESPAADVGASGSGGASLLNHGNSTMDYDDSQGIIDKLLADNPWDAPMPEYSQREGFLPAARWYGAMGFPIFPLYKRGKVGLAGSHGSTLSTT